MIGRLVLIGLAIAATPALGDESATLTLKIENLSAKGGDLRCGVYDQASFVVRGSKPVLGKIVAAKPGAMSVVFEGLKPGEYGVKCYQDENRNGHLDMGMMGMMPEEPYGMSNDAKAQMSGPPWDEAHFALKPGAATITIHLH